MAADQDAIKLDINGRIVKMIANTKTIQLLRTDDTFLQSYILTAAKRNQFSFIQPDTIEYIHIKRLEPQDETGTPSAVDKKTGLYQVWCKKGRPNEYDAEASSLLIKLRSEKYKSQFEDKRVVKNKIWQEIANEIRQYGFDVDSVRCQQKFLNLSKSYIKYMKRAAVLNGSGGKELRPPDFFAELHDVMKDKIECMDFNSSSVSSNSNNSKRREVGRTDSVDDGEWMDENVTIKKDHSDLDQDQENVEDYGDDEENYETPHKKRRLSHQQQDHQQHDYSKNCDGEKVDKLDLYMERYLKLMEEKMNLLKEKNNQRREFLEVFKNFLDKF